MGASLIKKMIGIAAITALMANMVLFAVLKYSNLRFWLILIIIAGTSLGLLKLIKLYEK
ncbi:hypothetical protein JW968_03815 [Candidatus Woesearchaeota archaeon]|nr:hypothetical protein [Candidatus Woesearchaeota archaeon]